MDMEITLFGALTAGLLSFLAPCVLPIVPGYLSYITGVSAGNPSKSPLKVLVPILAFVMGFSTVFIALGAGASFVGQFLADNRELIAKIGGGIIVFFGLHFSNLLIRDDFPKLFAGAGLFLVSLYAFDVIGIESLKTFIGIWAIVMALYVFKVHMFLYRQMKKQGSSKAGALSSFITGLTFGAGWSPCIGPVLGSILLLASQQDSVLKGVELLAVYSVGLGIPFVLAGVFWTAFMGFIKRFSKFFTVVEYAGGFLLILMGVLVASGQLAIISSTLE